MKIIPTPSARFRRRVGYLAMLAAVLFCMGCGMLPGKLAAKDQALRKQVQADSFPTAKQVGL